MEIKKRYDFRDKIIPQLGCFIPENAMSNSFREATPSLYSLIAELPLIVSPDNKSLIQRLDDQWRILPAFKASVSFDSKLPADKF